MEDAEPGVYRNGPLIWRSGAALVCLLGFWGVSLRYEGFRIPYGTGIQDIHSGELVFSYWYLGLGLPAVLLLAWALDATRLPARALDQLRGLTDQPRAILAAALFALLIAVGVRTWVLQLAPVADDESTYVFIAKTLLAGGVVNPSPGDPEFFRNQFVILNEAVWYGKYPIGHPLVLAIGEALGLRALVGPLLTGLSLCMAFAIGQLILPRRQALLAAGLLLVSPQFLLTGATELSQTSSTLFLLVALYALLRLHAGAPDRLALLAGAALGFGVLIRPMPGALFVLVASLWVLVRFRDDSLARQVRRIAAGAGPLVLFGGLLALTQYLQTNDLTRSGYGVYHGASYIEGIFRLDWVATSLAGAFLRQNLWLFGWPLSFLFLPFATRSRQNGLLWYMILAEYAYRILIPKTVVASTGPIYVAEIVPLLALLSADGMANAAQWLSRHRFDRGLERVAGLTLASIAVALVAFVPVHIRDLSRSGEHWNTVDRLLDVAQAERSLVFAENAVDKPQLRSWAYYPRNPSPDLSDERIFVRLPTGEDGPQRAFEFW